MITAHTDVVGSLLRPAELLQAREDVAAGRITQAEFKRVEDWAVDQAIALQEAAGLDVLIRGLSMICPDEETLELTARLYDGLYEHRRRATMLGRDAS